jgi:hypothetical protein
MGPIVCPETSVQNYHSKLRNVPEECRAHLHRGGSLKSVCSCFGYGPDTGPMCMKTNTGGPNFV